MRVLFVVAAIVFLICCLAGVICYYFYKKDILHIGVNYVDKEFKKEVYRCVQIGDTLYCNDDFYGALDRFSSVVGYDLFNDMQNSMRICVVPDDYFEFLETNK